jgi:gas vesicle protein
LQGTRYLATNPKVIKLGLGIKGAANVAKGGFILGVVVSSGIEVAEFIFNDEKTMYDLVGGIGVEAVKAGLATLTGLAVGAAAGAITGIAVAPLIGLVVITLFAGIYLINLDKDYEIKKRVIDALKSVPEQTAQGIYMINTESESWLARVRSSVEVKQQEVGKAVHQGLMDWLCPVCRRY